MSDSAETSAWVRYQDQSSGYYYWHNNDTGESRWENAEGESALTPTSSLPTTAPVTQPAGTGLPAISEQNAEDFDSPAMNMGNDRGAMVSDAAQPVSSVDDLGMSSPMTDTKEPETKEGAHDSGAFIPANLRSRRATINPMYFTKKLQDWTKRAKSRNYAYELESGGGIPVRELLQGMYKIRRDKNIIELLVFIIFLLDLIVIVSMIFDTSVANETNAAIEDVFLDEEFPSANYKKNFYEIKTHSEFWEWVRGPLYNGAYQQEWYNGNEYTPGERGYVLHYLRLIGGVQLRQARVTNDSCQERRFVDKCIVTRQQDGTERCVPRFDTLDQTCFAEFSSVDPPFPPFGPPDNPTKYKYSTDLSSMDGLEGYGPTYGTGGYVVELPARKPDEAWDIINDMFNDQWTDRGTRAVGVTMNFYNTETKLASVARIMIEFFYSSFVITSARFYTFKIVLYESDTDMIRVACEGVLVLFWIYFLQKEIRRMIVYKPMILYFYRFSNLYEVTILALVLILIIQWIAWRANPLTSEFTVNASRFVDVFDYAYSFVLITSLAGFIVLICALKIFKYMSISKKMNALWLTLAMAAPDLIAFLVGFVVLIGGFAFTGQMLYGSLLEDFRNFEKSFSSLLRFPLGDFDYAKLLRARPSITATFFTLYVGIVFLVCMNMIIGIVTLYFEEVHQRLKTSDKWKLSTVSFEGHLLQRTLRFFRKYYNMCCGRCKKKEESDPALLHSGSSAQLRRDSESPAKNLKSLYGSTRSLHTKREGRIELENQFYKELRRFMRGCMWENNVDLYDYCDDVYKHSGGRNVYLGIHELCMLRESKPPPVGEYGPRIINKGTPNEKTIPATNAWRLLQMYSKLKKVILVGKVNRHAPDALRAMTTMRRYHIAKINMKGVRQERILCVDVPGRQLLNFTLGMRMKKKIPLAQMTQIELNTVDEKRLTLVFTAVRSAETSDVDVMDPKHQLGDNLETQYVCIFTSAEERRDFVRAVLDARKGILSSVHRKDPKLYEIVQRFSKGRSRKVKLGKREVYISDLLAAMQQASRDINLGMSKSSKALKRTASEPAQLFRGGSSPLGSPASALSNNGTSNNGTSNNVFNESLEELSETVNANSAALNSIQGQLARLERLLTAQQSSE